MMLHELKPAAGSNKAAKRKGRGHGSGNGKTAGYGHKGQKARSGAKKAGFEGGQLPLQRRLPKVGFNNSVFATTYATIKVSDLEERFEANSVVDEAAVVASGLVKKVNDGIKVLGNGEITKPMTVQLKAFSASAKAKIEAAGGKAEVK
ncbi:MAG: 50S ribosomal protein L15 [Oscillospiraceae bacterium]|jgi:large subunit ribosomal protein L15|nr:50S ribosomal protein L15 [Oscillospiraceae bacterium]